MFVGLGGACGSILRYSFSLLADKLSLNSSLATFAVNGLGSLLIGFVMALCDKGSLYLFAAIGLCGGFTTFSTFSAQALAFLQSGRYAMSLLYMFGSVGVCLLAVWFGLFLGNKLPHLT